MDKSEGRRILKGLQLITNFRDDTDAGKVLEEVAAFVELNKPKPAKRDESVSEAPPKTKRGLKS